MRDGHPELGPMRLAAVVLAGGQARRLGGRDKPMVAVGGVPMVRSVLAAAAGAGAAPLVVVGPGRDGLPGGVRVVREEPPGGGPVAAAAAGLEAVGRSADVVALLAADLPWVTAEAIGLLTDALVEGDRARDGAVFVDDGGRRQWLCGVWRIEALAANIRQLASVDGVSLRALTAGLDVAEVRWGRERPPYFDCDTEEDLRKVVDE
ncbi:hypothetical protein GCM10022255_003660 [Dactylosporangium darangshiense]|uniref:MobA-like NTP transferase domain-containing protein n=2 Tax=Dactylosporangium darangshiense TaxID=579108 RepID=A0ABP8CUU0_9ACTN